MFDHPDGEAGQVHFAWGELAGVLGQLAAQDGAPGLPAAVGHTPHDVGHSVRVEVAPELVVEEEERLGPLADEVVDAHGHQVDADLVHRPWPRRPRASFVPTPSVEATRTGCR